MNANRNVNANVNGNVNRNRNVNGNVNHANPNLEPKPELERSPQPVSAAPEDSRMLMFHRLAAYQYSIQFLRLALEVIREVPRGHADDIDQLRRSAKSTARNIAEGAGRLSPADKVKHYAIARGEAVESACSLDVMRLEGTITEDCYKRGIELLEQVIATLSGLINKPE